MKLEGKIDVIETGKKIQSWFIETNPKVGKSNEFQQRLFDAISRVTGTEPNNLPVINFVGLGRLLIKFNNEVFFIPIQLD